MMLSITITLVSIAILVACASAVPGALLFLRKASLVSDAISHSVLLGIAIMFLLVQSLTSIWLFIGATLAGVLTVIVTEAITQSGLLKQDASIGVVFPCFFSIGVLIISLYARDVHLDIDMVALGEIAFAPFYRFYLWGYDIGPRALWIASSVGVVNATFVYVCNKELSAALFDMDFSRVVGLRPRILSYVLMLLTSITAVGVFEVVGSVVVVALMITPAVSAYLLVTRFNALMQLAPLLGAVSAVLGYIVAWLADVSIAGAIAAMSGVVFVMSLLLAPYRGIVARWSRRRAYRNAIAYDMVHAYLQSCTYQQATPTAIAQALQWPQRYIDTVVEHGVQAGSLRRSGAYIQYILRD